MTCINQGNLIAANQKGVVGRTIVEDKFNVEALSNLWNQWILSYDRARQLSLLARLGLSASDGLQLAGMMALALALPVAVIALITLRPRRPADPLERCWLAFCDKLADAGIERRPYDTPNRLLARAERSLEADASRAAARLIVSSYNSLRYDAPRFSSDALRQLRRRIDAFSP